MTDERMLAVLFHRLSYAAAAAAAGGTGDVLLLPDAVDKSEGDACVRTKTIQGLQDQSEETPMKLPQDGGRDE